MTICICAVFYHLAAGKRRVGSFIVTCTDSCLPYSHELWRGVCCQLAFDADFVMVQGSQAA